MQIRIVVTLLCLCFLNQSFSSEKRPFPMHLLPTTLDFGTHFQILMDASKALKKANLDGTDQAQFRQQWIKNSQVQQILTHASEAIYEYRESVEENRRMISGGEVSYLTTLQDRTFKLIQQAFRLESIIFEDISKLKSYGLYNPKYPPPEIQVELNKLAKMKEQIERNLYLSKTILDFFMLDFEFFKDDMFILKQVEILKHGHNLMTIHALFPSDLLVKKSNSIFGRIDKYINNAIKQKLGFEVSSFVSKSKIAELLFFEFHLNDTSHDWLLASNRVREIRKIYERHTAWYLLDSEGLRTYLAEPNLKSGFDEAKFYFEIILEAANIADLPLKESADIERIRLDILYIIQNSLDKKVAEHYRVRKPFYASQVSRQNTQLSCRSFFE